MHVKGIVHRDLKPENVLLKAPKGVLGNNQIAQNPLNYRIKICDLGAAKVLDTKPSRLNTPYVVSRYYRAPELIMGSHLYDSAIDVWAAGCIFFELLAGIPVFPGENEGMQILE